MKLSYGKLRISRCNDGETWMTYYAGMAIYSESFARAVAYLLPLAVHAEQQGAEVRNFFRMKQ